MTANFIPQGTGGTGQILREYWLNVTGTTISSLTSNAAYPASPTGSEMLTSLEGATNIADNYGARIRGYIHPLITGQYTFSFASDDAGDLLLSTSDNPANATRIAFVAEWTDPRQWNKFGTQRSAGINLTAGQKYYVEVLHKEATGGDHFAVAWEGPGIPLTVIGGNLISPFVAGPVTSLQSCGHEGRHRYRHRHFVARGHQLRHHVQRELRERHVRHAHAGGGQWLDVRRLGGACTGTGACTVSMTAARAVTATFNSSATTFALSVTKAGTGAGTVTSSPAGINCGTTCSANYASGTSVTLTAAAASGSTFAGWSGACTGTGACTVSMTAARAVTATFNSVTVTDASPLTRARRGAAPGAGHRHVRSPHAASQLRRTTLQRATTRAARLGDASAPRSASRERLDVRRLERRVHRHRNLHGVDDGGAHRDGDVQHTGTGTTCANPVTFTNNTGNFNTTGAACYRTSATVNGWGCSNFDGRTVTVGGLARTCGQLPLTRSSDGYYYFSVTAGTYPVGEPVHLVDRQRTNVLATGG